MFARCACFQYLERLALFLVIKDLAEEYAEKGKLSKINIKRNLIFKGGIQMVLEITDQNFEDEVLKSEVPVVVDFWAPWCGPCHKIAPLTEKLSKEYEGKLKFCKLNVDENPKMAKDYQVMSIPLLLFFRGGKKVGESLGAVPESVLRPKVEGLL